MGKPKEWLLTAIEEYGNEIRQKQLGRGKVAELVGISTKKARILLEHLRAEKNFKPKMGAMPTAHLDRMKARALDGNVYGLKEQIAKQKGIRKYIITSAQSNTKVHHEFWLNLLAYAKHQNAQVMVSRFTYNKAAYGAAAVKPDSTSPDDYAGLWFDPEIMPYCQDTRIRLAPDLIFCGELNILPTAARPLSGFEGYGAGSSIIVPHAKRALESIPTFGDTKPPMNYTTGAVTLKNYLKKKAGLKAEFHHCYGALMVEIDANDDWWIRELNATEDGSFQDLNNLVSDQTISENNAIEGIVWGDFHTRNLRGWMLELMKSIREELNPKYQFVHDLLDFRSRNHHDTNNPHQMFLKYAEGIDNVEQEVAQCYHVLNRIEHQGCQTIVVDSNHDNALTRWLAEADFKQDPLNALYYLRLQLNYYQALSEGNSEYHVLEEAVKEFGEVSAKFLRRDESFKLNGVECGNHGDLGANGARGTPLGLSKMASKTNSGHTHSAQVIDGAYVAGIMSDLNQGYNKGASSWTHSFIAQYPNGKRTIITIRAGKAYLAN